MEGCREKERQRKRERCQVSIPFSPSTPCASIVEEETAEGSTEENNVSRESHEEKLKP